MPRGKQETGERDTYSARYRITVGPAIGWDDSHDPSTLPNEALVTAINVRIHDGIIVSRGGQTDMNPGDPAAGCIYGMIETNGGVRMFLNPKDTGTSLGMFDIYDEGLSTPYVRLSNSNSESGIPNNNLPTCDVTSVGLPRYCFARWGDKTLISAADNTIYEVILPTEGLDITQIKLRELFHLPNGKQASCLYTIPGFPSTLYIGTTAGDVYSYDGTTAQDISPTTPAFASERVILASLNGNLVAVSTDDFKVRTGAAWTDITLSDPITPTCALEFGGSLYVGGYDGSDGLLYVIDYSFAAVLGDVLTGIGDSCSLISDLAVWQGDIWFLWKGILSITPFQFAVGYVNRGKVLLDDEGVGLLSRLVNIGERLFVGETANIVNGVVDVGGAQLAEVASDGLGGYNQITKVDTFALLGDIVGAFDIIFF